MGQVVSSKINLDVGLNVTNLSELEQMQNSLRKIYTNTKDTSEGMKQARDTAQSLSKVLTASFNQDLGSFNMTKLNTELQRSNLTIQSIKTAFSAAGNSGATAFNLFASQILKTNIELKSSNKLLDDMAKSLGNTVKWGISSSLFNTFTSSIQKAYDYVVDLDSALTDIRIVTDKSSQSMERFAVQAQAAAKSLGASTLDYTEAALIYYQQGLGDEDSQKLAEVTLKAANVTGQSAQAVSEQLTAVWNGYKVTAEEAELYVDKLAAVAASTAADLEELSTGMSKVASAANLMGVDVDQLNAMLATVVSVTRQAPESVGTAFKTIYARMGDIEAGIDTETTLGHYTAEMDALGINVLNTQGQLRDMGEVIEEIGGKWNTYTREQQVALSQTMAGTRQYNNLLSLFDNWDMYTEAIGTSQGAIGTLDEQQEEYMQSTRAHLEKLSTQWESLYDNIIQTDELNVLIDIFSQLVGVVNQLTESFGGGLKALGAFGVGAAGLFHKQIGQFVGEISINRSKSKNNLKNLSMQNEVLAAKNAELGSNASATDIAVQAGLEAQLQYAERIHRVELAITDEQKKQLIEMQNQMATYEQEAAFISAKLDKELISSGFTELQTNKLRQNDEYYRQEHEKLSDRLLKQEAFQEVSKDSLETLMDYHEKLDSNISLEEKRKKLLGEIHKFSQQDQGALTKRGKELRAELKLHEKKVKTNKNLKKVNLEILDIIEEIHKEDLKSYQATDKKAKALEKVVEEETKIENLNAKKSQSEANFNEQISYMEHAMTTSQRVTQATSALSSLVGVWGMTAGVVNTIFDESLTTAEKWVQALGSFAAGITALTFAYKALVTIQQASNAQKASETAMGVAYETYHRAILAGKSEEVAVETALTAAKTTGITVSKEQLLSELLNTKSKAKNIAATLAQTAATKGQTVATIGAKKANDQLNKSFWSSPLALYLALLTVFVGLVGGIATYLSNAAKKQREENDAMIESSNATQEKIDANRELYQSYEELYLQYKANKIAKEELEEAGNSVITALEKEGVAVEGLTEDYEKLYKVMKEQERKELEKGVTSATHEKASAGSNVIATARDGRGRKEGSNYFMDLKGWDVGKDKEEKIAYDILTEQLGDLISSTYSDGWENRITIGTDLDADSIVDLYDKLSASRDQMEKTMTKDQLDNSGFYSQVNEWLERMEEDVDKYKAAAEDVVKYNAELKAYDIDFDSISDYTDYKTKKAELIEKLRELGVAEDKLDSTAEYYISQESAAGAEFVNKENKIDALIEKNKNFSESDRAKLEETVGNLTGAELTAFYTLEPEEIRSMDLLDEYIQKAKAMAEKEAVQLKIETSSSAIDSLYEGKELTEEQLTALKSLEKEYPELQQIQDKQSSEYLQELIAINEELEDQKIKLSETIAGATIEEAVSLDVNTENFEEEITGLLEDIAEQDYSVLVDVKADIQSDFDNTMSSLTGLEKMAEKIGENFIVAAEDLEELNDAFPGILAGMTLLADGTAQLSRESVEASIAGAQAEIKADSDKTIEKLKNQQAELLAKRDAAKAVATIAEQMIGQEKMTAEQEASLDEALNELKMDNTETTADYEQDTQGDVVTASQINSEAMAQNWSGAYKKMAEDSAKWAQAAKNNMQVASTGRGNVYTGADITTQYSATGSKGTVATAEKGQLKNSSDVNNKTDWAAVANYYNNLASSYDKAANNVQGKIAEILARNNQFYEKTGNIARGAGSGKGSEKDPDVEENIDEMPDRYHDINIELAQITNNLEKVQQETEKLVGQELIDNLQKQYNLLNREIDLTAEKIGIARQEQEELAGKLANDGVTFNKDGTIANYEQAYMMQLAYVNSVIDHYNSLSADGQEAYQSTLDQAKADWESFLDNVEKYDTLITEDIPELEADIRDAMDQQIELKLEAFEYEIGIRLDLAEAERDWNEFKTRIIDGIKEDDILGNAESKLKDFGTYYNAQGTGEIDATATHVNKILQQLYQMDADQAAGVYGEKYSYTNTQGELVTIDYNNRKQALEDLKEYYTQLTDSMTSLQELSEEIHQSYLDMMDETQEKFDEQLDTYEKLSDMISHDMNLTSLIFGEESYSLLADFYKKQKENSLEQLDFQRKQVDFWKAQMDAAEEGTEEWENAKEKWQEAIDSWKDGSEKAIQDTIDEYTNAVGVIFEELNNKVTGGVGLDYASKEWELINKEADRYLDSINTVYKTQSLQNKYLDAIEKSANPAMQQKINNIMEDELALLREKDKLSEYDIERANLRYEIAMKQLALEESQQKKTQLRLRRDSQGNYRYQYTEDENEVSKIKQELSDLYNQLYNLDTGQYKSNLDELYAMWEEFNQEMWEASKINDPEEKARTELLIKEKYGNMINDIVADNEFIQKNLHESTLSELFDLYGQNTANYEQMTADQQEILDWFLNSEMKGLSESAFNNLFGLYDDNVNAFKGMTDEEIKELTSSFVPQFNTTYQEMADVIKGEGGFVATCKDAFDALTELGEVYLTELTRLYDEYLKKSEAVQNETQELVQDNDELIKTYQDQLDKVQEVINQLEKLEAAYSAAAESAKKAAIEAKEYWTAAQNKNANVDADIKDSAPKTTTTTDTPKEVIKKPKEEQKQSLALNSYVKVKSGQTWYAASDGSGSTGTARSGTIVKINSGSKYPYNIDWLGWVKKESIEGYDTGGYTGEWSNSDGKLAMLHQKELVLNANDTKNILNAVEILRGITNNLGQALMNQMASISATGATAIAGTVDSESLEQNVHIDAQFPNVKDSREIETALNNLVNMASQHIQKN